MRHESARVLLPRVLLWSGVVLLAALGARAAWKLNQTAELVRLSEPLQRAPRQPLSRLLIVGDSSGVGTGASSPATSLAGRLAAAFPRLRIDNHSVDGAQFADVLAQLEGADRYDMVLVNAGGNDVIRLRDRDALRAAVDRITRRALERADQVVLMPAGNVGNAPFFFPPVSWFMTWRSRQMHQVVRDAAVRHGVLYIDLFREREADPFVQRPELNARDGLHPSDAGYALWFDELMAQADLQSRLSAAAAAAAAIAPRRRAARPASRQPA